MTHSNMRAGRTLGGVAAIVLAGATMTACAGEDTPPTAAVEGSTITIGTYTPLAPRYEAWATAYMEEFPDRKVEIVPVSEDFVKYQQILATQRISETMPDLIFNVDSLANAFADDDLVLDISQFLKDEKDGLGAGSFLPQFLDQYRPIAAPEKITGLPVSADSTALVYNKTLFDEAGVSEYPTPEWTWDDYVRVATEIQTKSSGQVYGSTPPASNGGNMSGWGPVLLASGVEIYDPETNKTDIDSPAALRAWESLMPFYGAAGAPLSAVAGDAARNFGSGQVAMGITSSALIGSFREPLAGTEWDIAQVPLVNGKHASGGGSYGFSISATSKQVDAAWAFLAWFYDPQGGSIVSQSPEGGSSIPPTFEGLEGGPWAEAEVPANIGVLAQTAKDALLTVQMPGATQTVLTNSVKLAFEEHQLGGVSLEDAFRKAADTVNKALAAGS